MSEQINPSYLRPHQLEEIFSFENYSFRRYMQLEALGHITPGDLYSLFEGMANSPEPIVRGTAGWALAEVALHRQNTEDNAWKYQALYHARELWEDAAEDITIMLEEEPSDKLFRRYSFSLLRFQLASLHVPAMDAICQRMATRKNTPQEQLDITYDNQVRYARSLLKSIEENPHQKASKGKNEWRSSLHGAAYELLVSMLLCRHNNSSLIAIPSSIRQDTHPILELRSDIMVHDFRRTHYKKPIQIKGNCEDQPLPKDEAAIYVAVRPHLLLPGTKNALPTLQALVAEYEELTAAPNEALDLITSRLLHKIDTFRVARKPTK